MSKHLSSRIAARATARQIDAILMADRAANAVDAEIIRQWRRLMIAISQQSPLRAQQHAQTALAGIVPIARRSIANSLDRMTRIGHRSALETLGILPTNYLRTAALQRIAPVQESLMEADMPMWPGLPNFGGNSKPGIIQLVLRALGLAGPASQTEVAFGPREEPAEDPLPATEQRAAFSQFLFPPPSAEQVNRIVYAPVAGVTWEQRLEAATRTSATPTQLAQIVGQGVAQGKMASQIAKDLLPVVDGVRSTARRIARSEAQRVYNAANFEAHQGLGDMVQGYQILATLDENTRSEHSARNGQIFYLNPKLGQRGMGECPHPPLEADGSMAWNCVLPGQFVQGRVKAALKAIYAGEIVKFRTLKGESLSVTINHPVATENGFVRAGDLKKGDKSVSYSREIDVLSLGKHDQHSPALIEDVFNTFNVSLFPLVKRSSAFDLYGDGEFIKGDIHIVKADAFLRRCRNAATIEGVGDFGFNWPCRQLACLSSFGRDYHRSFGHLAFIDVSRQRFGIATKPMPSQSHGSLFSAGSYSDSSKSSYDGSVRDAESGCNLSDSVTGREHLLNRLNGENFRLVETGGFGPSAHHSAIRSQTAGKDFAFDADLPGKSSHGFSGVVTCDDDPDIVDASFVPFGPASQLDVRLNQNAGHSIAVNAHALRELRNRFPGVVTLDEIVEIERVHYDGPVYDLETDTGYFIVNGVKRSSGFVVANCRCHLVPVLQPADYIENDPALTTIFRNAQSEVAPDPVEYRQWYANADERRRRLAVGGRRYDTIKAKIGDNPPWESFLDPETGSLLPLQTLKSERPATRARRIDEVRSLIDERAQALRRVLTFGSI